MGRVSVIGIQPAKRFCTSCHDDEKGDESNQDKSLSNHLFLLSSPFGWALYPVRFTGTVHPSRRLVKGVVILVRYVRSFLPIPPSSASISSCLPDFREGRTQNHRARYRHQSARSVSLDRGV